MSAIVDTDVLIDVLRGRPSAGEWLRTAGADSFIVPGFVAMELVVGCRSLPDLQRCNRFLSTFPMAHANEADGARAMELLNQHQLGTKLGIADAYIAAMALNRGLPLYSWNTRHFKVISGLRLLEPYVRSSDE